MATLRVPSLQHLARNWRDSPTAVKRELVRLAQHSPTFSYNPLFSAVRDLLILKQPYEEVAEGIRRAIKREDVRSNLLTVLPLIERHFRDEAPDFIQSIARRYYPVSRDLLIPFDPPLIYRVSGQLRFPWFSFWRSNPLSNDRLSLFVTLVDEVLFQDPDLDAARFDVLDFSVPRGERFRDLVVIDARDVPRVSEARKREMLSIFAEGFQQAKDELAKVSSNAGDRKGDGPPSPEQPDLFK